MAFAARRSGCCASSSNPASRSTCASSSAAPSTRSRRTSPGSAARRPADNLAEDIYDYMMERLRAWYLERGGGVTTEMFDAVLDTRPASPLDFDERLRALCRVPGAPRRGRAHRRQQAHREHPEEGGRTAEPARRSRAPHRRERAPACDRDRIAPAGRRAARHGAALCGRLDAARVPARSGRRVLRKRDGDGRRRARAREPARAARGAPAPLPAHREPVPAAGLKKAPGPDVCKHRRGGATLPPLQWLASVLYTSILFSIPSRSAS